MHIRTLISPIALAAAMSLSGGAMAQTMVGGVDIPAEDLPEVQAQCDTLAAEGNESLTETADDTADGDADDDEDADNTPSGGSDDDASDLDQAVTSIDLNTITLEQCKEAGLVQ